MDSEGVNAEREERREMRFRVLVVTQRKRVAEVELAVLAEPQLRVGDGGEKELMDYCFISEGRG